VETWVADLEAVVDAAGVDRFTLLGVSQGAAIALVYAARHPERLSRLVLYEDIGHLPFVEAADRFDRELAAFAGQAQ
jgi:pimeloyl-ACP methyl ester carboxylesterase